MCTIANDQKVLRELVYKVLYVGVPLVLYCCVLCVLFLPSAFPDLARFVLMVYKT